MMSEYEAFTLIKENIEDDRALLQTGSVDLISAIHKNVSGEEERFFRRLENFYLKYYISVNHMLMMKTNSKKIRTEHFYK